MGKYKHKYRHHKMNPARKIVKTAAGAGGSVIMALPAILPIMAFGTAVASGASITNSVDRATASIGFSTGGAVDMAKVAKYGIFTAVCLGTGYVMKKLIAKHV